MLFNGHIKTPETTDDLEDINLSVTFICEPQKPSPWENSYPRGLFPLSILPTPSIWSDPHHPEIYRLTHFINLQ